MFTFSAKSIAMFILVSIAWYFGFQQLWFTVTNFSTEWGWYVGCVIYAAMLNEWFLHNILAHRRFEVDTSRWAYKVLTLFATIGGLGNPRTFVLVHKAHHKWADIPGQDFLYPPTHWFTSCISSPLMWVYHARVKFPNEKKYFENEKKKFSNIVNDPWTNFCDQHKVSLTIAFWTFLYFVAPVVLFKLVFMSRAILSIIKVFLDIVGHLKLPLTYRNFNVRDNSTNFLISHYLALGTVTSLLHNNHHGFPEGPKGHCPHSCHWYEIDVGYYGVELLRPLLEKKNHL